IVNQRTGHVVDGHARIVLAISRGEAAVPVVYVDLDEDEERLILATLDPLSAMAETGSEAMAALMALLTPLSLDLVALTGFDVTELKALLPPERTMPSIAYDAVFVAGGAASAEALIADGDAVHYIAEAYKHFKPIAAGPGTDALLEAAGLDLDATGDEVGVLLASSARDVRALPARLIEAMLHHRFFNRPDAAAIPA
ncbi:MAG: hypothetical protein O2798_10775, partial [Chloroflexi bacterium]|nr:hypothetical protein [Chloroflexota bacterium]